jgi:hypothetical protein
MEHGADGNDARTGRYGDAEIKSQRAEDGLKPAADNGQQDVTL